MTQTDLAGLRAKADEMQSRINAELVEALKGIDEFAWSSITGFDCEEAREGLRKRIVKVRAALANYEAQCGERGAKWPKNLHPKTADLIERFSAALAKKLRLAEEKYGWSDGWSRDDWEDECRNRLYEHLQKGDPRDVAAYCAFMWHHDWITYRPDQSAPPAAAPTREIDQHIAWLYQYVLCMNEQNWRDMQTNLERQLDRLKVALSAPAAEQQERKAP